MAKWIDDIQADSPVSALAQRALADRLHAVWKNLAPAAEHADEDVEHIHDLRVASRRAVATVNLFGQLLPRKRRKWFDRKLRDVRRASGEARDLDVFAAQLPKWVPGLPPEQLQIAQHEIAQQRTKAQPEVERVSKRLRRNGYPRRVTALLKRVRWRDDGIEPNLRNAAVDGLRPVVESFVAAAGLDLRDYAQLHRFRVAGKRLRYAAELLASGFDRTLPEQIYPQLVDLQDRLGEINDYVSALAHLGVTLKADLSDEQQQALKSVSAALEALLSQQRQDFLQWWTPDRASGLTTRLSRLVASSDYSPTNAPVASQAGETNGRINTADAVTFAGDHR